MDARRKKETNEMEGLPMKWRSRKQPGSLAPQLALLITKDFVQGVENCRPDNIPSAGRQ